MTVADPHAPRTPTSARTLLRAEVAVVLGLAVGLAALRSVLNFIAAAQAPGGLATRSTTLNRSLAPDHPWVDLGLQLVFVLGLLLPPTLVVVLAGHAREPLRSFGVRTDRWRRDVALGVGAAAGIGGVGLAGYLVGHAAGLSLTVVPTGLPDVWWRIPVLVLSAVANATLEEVVLVGYLLRRGDQLGWSPRRAVATSAVLRGGYHLYQGLPGCLGNAAMGVIFARYFQRSGRIGPLLVAHALIDVVAFVGYLLLAGHVNWLPT